MEYKIFKYPLDFGSKSVIEHETPTQFTCESVLTQNGKLIMYALVDPNTPMIKRYFHKLNLPRIESERLIDCPTDFCPEIILKTIVDEDILPVMIGHTTKMTVVNQLMIACVGSGYALKSVPIKYLGSLQLLQDSIVFHYYHVTR